MIDAGRLRHYATVQNPAYGEPDARGQVHESWQTVYGNVPSEILTMSGRELELAKQIVPQATTKITMRYHSSVTNKSRIVWQGNVYNVEYVDNVQQRNLVLVLTCTHDIKNSVPEGAGSGA